MAIHGTDSPVTPRFVGVQGLVSYTNPSPFAGGRRNAALLYILLTFNAHEWNAGMRKRLREQLTATEVAYANEHFHTGGIPKERAV